MRFRKLRIAWSVFWGLAAALLIVLWVRSYWWTDTVWGYVPPSIGFSTQTICGELILKLKAGSIATDAERGWAVDTSELDDYLKTALSGHIRQNTVAGIGMLDERPKSWIVFLPIWAPT